MNLTKVYKNTFLALILSLVLSACATQKKGDAPQLQGDVYTGTDTVKYLASGVPDRVFFATNESILTTKSRDTLRKQAACALKVSLEAVVNIDSFVAKNTLSFTPSARYPTVSVPV